MRREWIEIKTLLLVWTIGASLPPCGGSGLKYKKVTKLCILLRLPPCGGSGLKYAVRRGSDLAEHRSPSMRREWLEMVLVLSTAFFTASPSMRREWIEIQRSLKAPKTIASPSMRREWIEIFVRIPIRRTTMVSLHAEGVD